MKNDERQSGWRARAVSAAQGSAPFDLLLLNATVVDCATSELRAADVGIVGSLIASVHPRGSRADASQKVDLYGQYLAPGFIDTHVHFESSHMTPANYASVVVPQGTTTIFYDPHELANVLGVGGVRYAIDASRDLPLRFICAAPSCVPSAPGLEASGAEFGGAEMREMLAWPEVAGVAEVMDMAGLLAGNERMRQIVAAGIESGKLVEGHARGLSGARLQAYVTAGVGSDHEITSAEDAIEKLRSGLTVELRGSHDYVLPGVVEALKRLPQIPSTLTVCTDDVPPDYLVENGGMCDVLRRLVRYGMDPVQAIRCATLNAATRLRRDDLGLIAAGRIADLVVLSDLRDINVKQTFVSGKVVARDKKMIEMVKAPDVQIPASAAMPKFDVDDFRVKVEGVDAGRALVRIIKGVRFTEWGELEVDVKDGFAVVPPDHSVIFVQHRHGQHAKGPQRAILEGWGEVRGAIATSYSHDSHNLVVIGRVPQDMYAAASAVTKEGGGMAVVQSGKVTAQVAMPLAGMLSSSAPEKIAEDFRRVREAAGKVVEWKPPYRVFKAIEGTCLACNPGPHLTDLGLTDGTTGEIVPTLLKRL